MSVEFVDTNVFVYASDSGTGPKFQAAVDLIARLAETGSGAISTQVLSELYNAATTKITPRQPSSECRAKKPKRLYAIWVRGPFTGPGTPMC